MAKKPAPKKAAKPVKKVAKPAPKKAAKPAPKKAVKPKAKVLPKKVAKAPVKKKEVPKAKAKKDVAKKKTAPKPAAKSKAPAKTGKTVMMKTAPVSKKAAPKAKVPAKAVKTTAKASPAKATKAAPKKAAPPVKKAPAVAAPVPKVAAAKPSKKKKKAVVKEPTQRAPKAPLVTQRVAPNRPMSAPIVKKQVSTLEHPDKLRYNDDELVEFKDLIVRKLDEARKDYDLLKQTLANTDNNGTDDTSPSFKMIEDGSETLSREETAQLAGRQEKFIKHLEDALLRIRNKTYGICRVTGRLISKERLRLVPHATLSIEAKQQMGN